MIASVTRKVGDHSIYLLVITVVGAGFTQEKKIQLEKSSLELFGFSTVEFIRSADTKIALTGGISIARLLYYDRGETTNSSGEIGMIICESIKGA